MDINVTTSWLKIIQEQSKLSYWPELELNVDLSYDRQICYPQKKDIFRCFNYFDFKKTKVVILGQDPYYTPYMANGLAFSTDNTKLPQSLKNIYKELQNDLGVIRTTGDLSDWANQGVLLLNNALSVTKDQPNSHLKFGWNIFTDNIINQIDLNLNGVIFVLWGNFAKTKIKLLTNKNNYVISSAHPSPLSAYHGFFGSKCFSKINEILQKNGDKPIKW